MADTARDVAEKAMEAARVAAETARLVKVETTGMMTELRERLNRQDDADKQWREQVAGLLKNLGDKWDAFKSDFGHVENTVTKHHKTIYGDPDIKEDSGIVGDNVNHKAFVRHAKWHLAIATILGGWLIAYVIFFYGDAMKRGIFNPSEQEWHWRITREVKKAVKPEALRPPEPEHN